MMTKVPSSIPEMVEGVDIEISGIHDEDEFVKDVVRKEVTNSVKKMIKTVQVSRISIHVKKSDQQGRRARFDVDMRAFVGGSEFHADGFEWDLPKSIRGALDNMEAALEKYAEKKKYHTDHSGKGRGIIKPKNTG